MNTNGCIFNWSWYTISGDLIKTISGNDSHIPNVLPQKVWCGGHDPGFGANNPVCAYICTDGTDKKLVL